MPSEFWTISDIARAMNVDHSTARRWTTRGDFPEARFRTAGGIEAWEPDEIREWRRGVVRERRARMAF